MNDLTKRLTCVSPWPHRLVVIAVLSVAASTTGCSVLGRFAPRSCSCNDVGCGESIAGCTAATSLATDFSQPIQYPQQLPIVDGNPASTALASHTDQWAPRHDVMARAATASCEKHLLEARRDFDEKLKVLESRFEEEHRANNAINDQLQVLHGDVVRLSKDVKYWENEVRRIDRTAEMHHRSDMANLQSLSKLIDQMVPRSASEGQPPVTVSQ
ncbi:MAG TPA: hypothetical protein EYG03_12600 [Planctomycetes bacterium]|nr:hypothetical protein [Fuerstiella sp.]HIK92803.1 hypothetical protein [Planctomycetota bacterium]